MLIASFIRHDRVSTGGSSLCLDCFAHSSWSASGTSSRRTTLLAQSAIAGVVRDATGAVLPGVTVEASSPALIEKVRTATTNEAGQYRVVDLRPGTYTVTFTLTGFNTVAREGILLEADFVAPVNVEMKVGSVQETITVTRRDPGRGRAVQLAPRGAQPGSARRDPDRTQFRLDGQHGAGGHHRRVRRRRVERDVDRRQPECAWVAVQRLAHADRRDGRRRDVRRRPVLLYLRQRSADAGDGGAGRRRQRGESDGRRARQPHPEDRREQVHGGIHRPVFQRAPAEQQRRPVADRPGHHHSGEAVPAVRLQLQRAAGRSRRTACGSSSRAATGPRTATWRAPSTRMAARRWTTTT